MTEEKKSKIRKTIAWIEIGLAVVLVAYLVYGIATKNSNQLIYNGLAIFVVAATVILNDFVEPYLLKVFENMDDYGKSAYRSYLLWDIASMAGVLFFVLNFSETGNMMVYAGLFVYFIGTTQKRPYQSAFLGEVTKEDVEAAKAAATDAEDVSVTDQKTIEE